MRRERGLTLIEVLIVLSIVGIVAAIAIPQIVPGTVWRVKTVTRCETLFAERRSFDATVCTAEDGSTCRGDLARVPAGAKLACQWQAAAGVAR